MAQPFQFDEWEADEHEDRPVPCMVCEAMCPDAVDGTLSEAERKAFDKHVAGCSHCAQELEDAQRGAAWLGLLKSEAPEPPATLLARILAETTGAETEPVKLSVPADLIANTASPSYAVTEWTRPEISSFPATLPFASAAKSQSLPFANGDAPERTEAAARNHVIVFRNRFQVWMGGKGVSALHPRLAMTAAMAFFSIALTLNLTGVRLSDLRAEDFRPTALQRTAANAEATAVRSFQSLRVVYQVESRVSELRQDPLWTERTGTDKNSRPTNRGDDNDPQSDGPGRN